MYPMGHRRIATMPKSYVKRQMSISNLKGRDIIVRYKRRSHSKRKLGTIVIGQGENIQTN